MNIQCFISPKKVFEFLKTLCVGFWTILSNKEEINPGCKTWAEWSLDFVYSFLKISPLIKVLNHSGVLWGKEMAKNLLDKIFLIGKKGDASAQNELENQRICAYINSTYLIYMA